jgi:hypothetical protein
MRRHSLGRKVFRPRTMCEFRKFLRRKFRKFPDVPCPPNTKLTYDPIPACVRIVIHLRGRGIACIIFSVRFLEHHDAVTIFGEVISTRKPGNTCAYDYKIEFFVKDSFIMLFINIHHDFIARTITGRMINHSLMELY